jgi:alpha-ketoglutarate-dependent dioxygenase alkB family protein 2
MDILFEELKEKAKKKNNPIKTYVSLKNNLNVIHYQRIISLQSCKTWFNKLETIQFPKNTKIKLMGQNVTIPRQQIAYGDIDYKYNGITVKAKKWTKRILKLKKLVERLTKCEYNFVLLNKYRDGNDYVSYHKDAEKELDHNAPIVSVSFGVMREFSFKHDDKTINNISLMLMDGDVVVMNQPTNKYWKHSILKKPNSNGVRYNFTFRKINI